MSVKCHVPAALAVIAQELDIAHVRHSNGLFSLDVDRRLRFAVATQRIDTRPFALVKIVPLVSSRFCTQNCDVSS